MAFVLPNVTATFMSCNLRIHGPQELHNLIHREVFLHGKIREENRALIRDIIDRYVEPIVFLRELPDKKSSVERKTIDDWRLYESLDILDNFAREFSGFEITLSMTLTRAIARAVEHSQKICQYPDMKTNGYLFPEDLNPSSTKRANSEDSVVITPKTRRTNST